MAALAATAQWDVIVAGAGPGGSSVATLLAERGVRVLVLEREEFPRFHVGESLLPAAELLTTALGVELDPNVFLFKRGAQFLCEATNRVQAFDFNEAMPGPQRYAWHVERAHFDTLLRDRARDAGADVRHGVSVEDVELDGEIARVRTGGETGGETYTARYFIDATGQDRFLARKLGTGRPYDQFGKAAVFSQWADLPTSAREELAPDNDIRVIVIPDGWLWAIPLTGNRLSAGLVSRKPGLRTRRLEEYLETSPLFARLLSGATRRRIGLVGNFSFENTRASGARFVCVGDSACFIDPVFSSGVALAILRAVAVAERLVPALAKGEEADPELMAPVEDSIRRGYETFAALVYRFYNTRFVDNMIFGAPDDGELRAGVISVLAGDVFRDDNPFQEMLLRSRRHPVGGAEELVAASRAGSWQGH